MDLSKKLLIFAAKSKKFKNMPQRNTKQNNDKNSQIDTTKSNLKNLPKKEAMTKSIKPKKEDKRKYPRPRAGIMQIGVNLEGKPNIYKNGKKVK